MRPALDVALAAVLGLWWVGSVATNVTPSRRVIMNRNDWMALLPDWWLFARPYPYDPILLSRELLADGGLTEWSEHLVLADRRWWGFAWNPGLGVKRAFLSYWEILPRLAAEEYEVAPDSTGQGTAGAIRTMATPAYLAVLRYVSARTSPAAQAVQFMLMGVEGQALTGRYDTTRGGRILFVSEFHRVDRRAAARRDSDVDRRPVLAH